MMIDGAEAHGTRLHVIDLETTGDSFASGGVVKVGWQDLTLAGDGRWVLGGGPGANLVNPRCPITSSRRRSALV